jgi:hypothetical protein
MARRTLIHGDPKGDNLLLSEPSTSGRVSLTPGCQIGYMDSYRLSSIEQRFDAQQ